MKKLRTILFLIIFVPFFINAEILDPALCKKIFNELPNRPLTQKEKLNYARIIVELAINVQAHDKILIIGSLEQAELAKLITDEAYRRGATYVEVKLGLLRALVERAKANGTPITYLPNNITSLFKEAAKDAWILIDLNDNFQIPDSDWDMVAPPLQRLDKIRAPHYTALDNLVAPWTTVATASMKWAAQVFGVKESVAARNKLWQLLKPSLFLDRTNPTSLWKRRISQLKARAKSLNALRIKYLHITNELGTNLRVHLSTKGIWTPAYLTSVTGRKFFANLPSFEVFTTPDYRKTNGIIFISKPVYIYDQKVDGIWLKFSKGKVVAFDAKEGAFALQELLKDERNRYLGEFALVNRNSPINSVPIPFHSALCDENAYSHIALGFALPPAIKGANQMSDKEKLARGINIAEYHIDLPWGTPKAQIIATLKDGSKVTIVKNGRFVNF